MNNSRKKHPYLKARLLTNNSILIPVPSWPSILEDRDEVNKRFKSPDDQNILNALDNARHVYREEMEGE
jgi:hypothetical protein